MGLYNYSILQVVPGVHILKDLSCKVHLMNLHAERLETGVRLQRATLKKANTSIAQFLDSPLIFQSVFRAAYRVTVLQRQKTGQTEHCSKAADKKEYRAIFEKTGLCTVIMSLASFV